MAEASLSKDFAAIASRIGHFLNYTALAANWSGTYATIGSGQQSDIYEVIQSGYKRFLYPRGANGSLLHRWSFMRPTLTLSLLAPYSTGTIKTVGTAVTGASTLFDTGAPTATGTWYLYADGQVREVTTHTNDTSLTIASAFSSDLPLLTTYSLKCLEYDMPANFGTMRGPMYYDYDKTNIQIEKIPVGRIIHARANQDTNGHPTHFATRIKAATAGATEQVVELMPYPTPDAAYDVHYICDIKPTALDTTYKYPLGGAPFDECILEFCLAEAERHFKGGPGQHAVEAERMLTAMIAYDSDRVADFAGRITGGGERSMPTRSSTRLTYLDLDGGETVL